MDPFEKRLAEGLRTTVPVADPDLRGRILASVENKKLRHHPVHLSFGWKMAYAFAAIFLLHITVVSSLDNEMIRIVNNPSVENPNRYIASNNKTNDQETISILKAISERTRLFASIMSEYSGMSDKEKKHGGI